MFNPSMMPEEIPCQACPVICFSYLSDLHRKSDPFFLKIYADDLDLYDIPDGDNIERVLYKLVVGHLGDVHQTVLVNTDVHKRAEIDDIPDSSLENHSDLQILHA